ncbi:hypothetical protein QE197_24415 (plasmid) [Arsenophonus nasoniae]|uniref:hypothetical protein n=1 Tax=Arsenophonus nasoniae TaxID=638 RepID=UPI0024688F40|nr:hypothetical protein [Arsenophonus nasoniae]WGM13596.1 hypothetical protein QE197_24415 [Arsenophonus nasoniae]WGM18339.1 hypothetical protein QE193_24685 [Arsenophonus nasoniae]
MNREQLLYQIYYSYQLNSMFSVLLGRIDKFLSFLLILLSSSVIGNLGNQIFVGVCIAVITAVRMAFSFEKTAESARKQAVNYLNLYTSQALTAPESQLTEDLMYIQKEDPNIWLSLSNVADLRTRQILGEPVKNELSNWEKLTAFLSGISVK